MQTNTKDVTALAQSVEIPKRAIGDKVKFIEPAHGGMYPHGDGYSLRDGDSLLTLEVVEIKRAKITLE